MALNGVLGVLLDEEVQYYKKILTSTESSKKDLERVCMRLAHSSTKEAKDLLEEFSKSDRASEVEWLQCAIDEGEFYYYGPNDDEERRDLIAMKLYHKKFNEIYDLEHEADKHKFNMIVYNIEIDALKALLLETTDEDEKSQIEIQLSVCNDLLTIEKGHYESKQYDINLMEKVHDKILQQITTERYKNLSYTFFDSFHFDYDTF